MSLQALPPLSEYRCICGRLLFKGSLVVAHVEIKCKRCGIITPFDQEPVSYGVPSWYTMQRAAEPDEFILHDAPRSSDIHLQHLSCEITGDAIITYMSPEACTLIGKAITDVLNTALYAILTIEDAKLYDRLVSAMKDTRSAFSVTVSLATPAGPYRVRAHHAPTYANDGAPRGYAILFEKSILGKTDEGSL